MTLGEFLKTTSKEVSVGTSNGAGYVYIGPGEIDLIEKAFDDYYAKRKNDKKMSEYVYIPPQDREVVETRDRIAEPNNISVIITGMEKGWWLKKEFEQKKIL